MNQRRKSVVIALTALFAACLLLGAAVWLHSRRAGDSASQGAAAEGGAEAHDRQSPVVAPKEPSSESEIADSMSDSTNESAEKTNSDAEIPTHFGSREETLNYFAKLVAEEFERLYAEDAKSPKPLTKEEAEWEAMMDEEYLTGKDAQLGEFGYSREDRKIRSLGWDALENVMTKIGEDEKYAALEEAMDPIWSVEGQEPLSLLVRAGRLPESVLYHKVELPNGEIYNMIAPMELVINFKRIGKLTEEGRRNYYEAERKETELLSRLAKGDFPENEAKKLNEELTKVQQKIQLMLTPVYITHQRKRKIGTGNEHNFKRVELNLGVVDEHEDIFSPVDEYPEESDDDE